MYPHCLVYHPFAAPRKFFFPPRDEQRSAKVCTDRTSRETVDAEVLDGGRESSKNEGRTVKSEEPPVATERDVGGKEKRGFQAETLKLLDIVTHSLYSDKVHSCKCASFPMFLIFFFVLFFFCRRFL